MKRRISLYALLTLTALFMGACEPVDIATFMKSEEVQEILDKIYVVLTDDSSAARRAYKSIILLDETKYYAIEEADGTFKGYAGGETANFDGEDKDIKLYYGYGDEDFNYYAFPTGNPPTQLIKEISKGGGESGRVTGPGLDNGTTYRVSTAVPITGTLTYHEGNSPVPSNGTKSEGVKSGSITLNEPQPNTSLYLDISSIFTSGNIEAAVVPLTGINIDKTSDITNGTIKLDNYTADYIFAEFDGNKLEQFFVLNVIITPLGVFGINVTIDFTSPEEPKLNGIPIPAQAQKDILNGNIDITITIDNAAELSEIEWMYNDVVVGGGASFNIIDVINDNNQTIGVHIFTILFKKDGIPYSLDFEFELY